MKPKTTTHIMACLNTPTSKVKTILENKGYNFRLILGQGQGVGPQRGTIVGSTCLTALLEHIHSLKRPPILWESAAVVRHVMLNQPVSLLDGEIMTNGLIFFKDFNRKLLFKLSQRKFLCKSKIKFEKASPKQYGNGSRLSILFNNFLSTLPDYIHEATIIAFVSAAEDSDYAVMDRFVDRERLITNENKKQYVEFVDYLTSIREYLKGIGSKDRKRSTDKGIKESVKRVQFLVKYYSSGKHRMKSYKDIEGGVNITSIPV